MDFVYGYVLPFVVVLSVLVFVHEWGHYIVARLCGVKVETFSIGFGKEIFGWTDKTGTRWKVSWVPLGGYVQMFGDVDPASGQHADGVKEGETVRPFSDAEKKVAFYTQHVGKRSAIVVAGPMINFLFAIFIMTALFAIEGQPYIPPIAASVMEGSAAEKAGIKPDDKVIAVDGQKIEKFQDLVELTSINLDKEMEMTVVHSAGVGKWNDKPQIIHVKPKLIEETDRFGFRHNIGKIGITAPKDAFEMKKHT